MCNYHQYSEETAVWLFQDFLIGDALLLANKRSGAQGQDIESRNLKEQLPTYIDVVRHLLHTYATNTVLQAADTSIRQYEQQTSQKCATFLSSQDDHVKKFGHAYSFDELVNFFLQNMEPRLSEHARIRTQETEKKFADRTDEMSEEKLRDELTALAKYMDTCRF